MVMMVITTPTTTTVMMTTMSVAHGNDDDNYIYSAAHIETSYLQQLRKYEVLVDIE